MRWHKFHIITKTPSIVDSHVVVHPTAELTFSLHKWDFLRFSDLHPQGIHVTALSDTWCRFLFTWCSIPATWHVKNKVVSNNWEQPCPILYMHVHTHSHNSIDTHQCLIINQDTFSLGFIPAFWDESRGLSARVSRQSGLDYNTYDVAPGGVILCGPCFDVEFKVFTQVAYPLILPSLTGSA